MFGLLFYFILAIGFNIASYTSPIRYTANDPLVSMANITFMTFLIIYLERIQKSVSSAIAVRVAYGSALVYMGIVKHLHFPYDERYHPSAWTLGVVINVVGVLILFKPLWLLLWRFKFVLVLVVAVAVPLALPQHTQTRLVEKVKSKLNIGEPKRNLSPIEELKEKQNQCEGIDKEWYRGSKRQYVPLDFNASCHPTLSDSLYVPGATPDIKIAVDIYFPCGYDPATSNKKLPVFFHMTRYDRRLSIRFPFNLIFGSSLNTRSKMYVESFVPAGYALVSMDTRGSGASSGTRNGDLLDDEVSDFVAVHDWVMKQKWSNGKSVSAGISYDGMAGYVTAGRGRLDAIMPIYSPVNVFSELAVAGGVCSNGFVDSYAAFTRGVERAAPVSHDVHLSAFARFFFNVVIDGPAPPTMSGSLHDQDCPIAAEARKYIKEDHVKNAMIDEVLRKIEFADDEAFPGASAGDLGISPERLQRLVDRGEPVSKKDNNKKENAGKPLHIMSYSGYFDSGAVRTSTTLYETITKRGSKENKNKMFVTVLPCTHGNRKTSSPFDLDSTTSCFNLGFDLVRFADFALGRDKESFSQHHMLTKPVRAFELQSNRWMALENMDGFVLPSSSSSSTTKKKVSKLTPIPSPSLPTTATLPKLSPHFSVTGETSRWNLVQHILMNPVTRVLKPVTQWRKDQRIARFNLEIEGLNNNNNNNNNNNENNNGQQNNNVVVFGSGLVSLDVKLSSKNPEKTSCANEGTLFFYLALKKLDNSSAAPDSLLYLTESQLRLGHKPHDDAGKRTFLRKDFENLQLGRTYRIQVALEPIRFLLKTHTQRLVLLISRRDDDNFIVPNAKKCKPDGGADVIEVSNVEVKIGIEK